MDIELNTPRQSRDANVSLPGGGQIDIPSYQLTNESAFVVIDAVKALQGVGFDNTPIEDAGDLLIHWETDENGFVYVGATRMVVR